ncbi:GRIP and coiled-coil domain-containing protein 2 [Microtus ochrogaster]|uniref:GRIP and coiled-coil domain-containing protein 2 n=1 Tax=Microtus ochrogaster TaxID=79684 RepID=A0ABM1TWA3_MICOH|nr:GRIP and coiled-coil domain-containing protein 2 [Microtus ochrogaster]
MEDPVQDGVAAAPSGTGKSKLETLAREDLIKFAKKQMMLLQKAKARCTELDKEIEELKSKPVDGGTDDIIKVLTERLDALLLEKAETEQQCLCLKKENMRMKQELEDSVTKLEDTHKEFEQSHRNNVNEIESLKNELTAAHSEHSKDKASLQKELEEAVNKQLELLEQLKSRSDSEDNVKQLQEEIQNLTAGFEEQIFCLQKQLEATCDEKKQEIIHLQKVIEENTQHYQKDINTFREEIVQLRAAHKEEVNELMSQMEASAKEHEAEISKLKDSRVQQCGGTESNQESVNDGTSDASQENQNCSVPLQEDPFAEQTVYDKVRQLEESLRELESQHSILKDEVTYMNNLKLKLEMEAQHIKDEFFHEREDLEFKINELLLAKEEQGYVVEKLKCEQEDLNRQLCCAVEHHNKEIQRLQELHQKEVSELSETFMSGSEKEKLALMFEIQGLKEQCENLQHEKQEAILNYESLREMMEILQTELGESAGKISQEFETMKQQQASDVHELQQKLRTAFNEKDALLETVNRLQRENEKLLSQQELVPELESTVNSLKADNSLYLASLGQKDTMLQELEAKLSSLAEEKDDFISKMKTCHEEIDNLHQKWEGEQRLTVELKEEVEQTSQHNTELRQRVDELTGKLDAVLREKSQNDQSVMVQIKTMTEDQEALSSKIKSLYEENNRLHSENVQLSKDLETLQSEKDFAIKEHVAELEGKLQVMAEERDNLNKVFENEQVQKSFVKTQLSDYLKQMGPNILEDNEEEDVVKVLQALGESLAKLKEERHDLVSQCDERVLELEGKMKCLQEESAAQCEELRALLRDSEQEKILLRKELEEATSTKEALQLDLLEMKNANEKMSLENQSLIAQVEELSQTLHRKNEVHNEKSLVIEHENLKLLLEQRESELQDVRAELILLKDSLEKSPSVKNDQLSLVKELEEKIESLEKESKDKDEKISKIKLVAVKAKKELDSNRKEAQTLKEELESVRSEKDRLSSSMKEFIQGAENYKNLLIEYDKQSEQLDVEKERANNFEHHIEDLTKQLRSSTCQCEKLNSDNEDLLARIETLQSNAKLLEVQILEVQKAKGIVDKELEAEKYQKEQKIKEHASAVKELEELQLQIEKEKKQLQKTMQELELVKKKNCHLCVMFTSKNLFCLFLLTLLPVLASLQSSVQHYEEKTTKIKQLLVKTKKELADAKQAESDHLLLQASLKGELEASQQQVEVYKIQLAEITSEKHKIHEHLKTSAEQHQRTLSAYQQRVAALQEESRTAKAEQAAVTSEFESYKVRVHNVLKQQKNKSVSQAETEGAKQEREHLEMLIDQLKIKLQDSQNSLQISVSEFQTLQSEHDTLLERHNRMLQETVTKEAELREKLCSVQSENTMMKSEHAQTVCQLTSQNEALRNSFRDQVRHLQDEHRKTVETLQHQLSKVEAQLFQLKSEPSTRSPASSHQPLKNPRERRNTDLPLLDMHTVAREEGEGMETADSESASSPGTHITSLEQLLSSPDTRFEQHFAEPHSWHAEFTKEELAEKLSSTTKSADHLNGLLRETEATNAILMEQIKLLKSEIRRLERNQEREKSVANLEYLKNVLLRFIFLKPGSEREQLLPVIDTMLQLSPEEKGKLATVAQGEEESASRSSGWASYLHSWSGLR